MKRKIIMSFLFVLAALGVWAAKVDKAQTIIVNGVKRSYNLYVPNNVKENAPLVFSLHGTGGHKEDKSPFRTSVADSKGCIVVYPQGTDIYFPVFGGTLPGWHSEGVTSDDIEFFKAIIDKVDSEYPVDHERIYCCGFSNGGMMTYTVANVASDIFAAFASISGFPLNEFHLHHTSARPVPFLHIHGKADDFVKYSLMPSIVDDMVARNGANPVPEVKTVSGKYKKSVYAATEGGFPYIYYEVDGMGHNDYTANTEDGNSALTMWKFFEQYTLSSPCDKTLKWRPNIAAEGWKPNQHGWITNTTTTLLLFGREQKTNANQNVYRSLQFEEGKYKVCFSTEGEEGKMLTVKIQKLTGSKNVVLNQQVKVGKDVQLFFDIEGGWGEYRFTILRESNSDVVTVKDLAIYSATADEEAACVSSISSNTLVSNAIYSTAGIKQLSLNRGVNIVKSSDGSVKKILR